MNWVEKFVNTVEGPRPVLVSAEGQRQVVELREAHIRSKQRYATSTAYRKFDLRTLRKSSAAEYLGGLGFLPPVSDGQAVYELMHGADRVLLPASVLLSELPGSLRYTGNHLLRLASLDNFAFQAPSPDGGLPTVRFLRVFGLPAAKFNLQSYQNTFLWLTGFRSARQMWASVREHATLGRLDLDLPAAEVNASFTVVRSGNICCAVRMNVRELTPLEAPIPSAIALQGRTFEFRHFDTAPGDEHLSLVANPLTQSEWELLAPILLKKVFDRSKPLYDIVLRKTWTNAAWNTFGPQFHLAARIYRNHMRTGKWPLFVEALLALREGRLCPMRVLPQTHHKTRLSSRTDMHLLAARPNCREKLLALEQTFTATGIASHYRRAAGTLRTPCNGLL